MFKPTADPVAEALDKAIADALSYLEKAEPTWPEYQETLDKVERLSKLRAPRKEARKPIDPNHFVTGAFSIASVLLILNYERAHVVTSKALSFVPKLKL